MNKRNSSAGTKDEQRTTADSIPSASLEQNGMLGDVLGQLRRKDYFFRLENDETGYYLSIIDRKIYPRLWADNFQDNQECIICESADNMINRTVLAEKDWLVRFFGDTIDECISELHSWIS